jgi:hypothetical protein
MYNQGKSWITDEVECLQIGKNETIDPDSRSKNTIGFINRMIIVHSNGIVILLIEKPGYRMRFEAIKKCQ